MNVNKDYTIDIDDVVDEIVSVTSTKLKPAEYQYYRNLRNRTIIINEPISADIVESVMLPLIEMDNDGTGEPITIRLSTVGGSLF